MTTEIWRVVADVERADEVERAFHAPGGMADTAHRMHLPSALVDQLQREIGAALRRAAGRDHQGQLIVSARASIGGDGAPQSWGFFLVEKPPHEAQPPSIEMFLYQEQASDAPT